MVLDDDATGAIGGGSAVEEVGARGGLLCGGYTACCAEPWHANRARGRWRNGRTWCRRGCSGIARRGARRPRLRDCSRWDVDGVADNVLRYGALSTEECQDGRKQQRHS